MTTRTWVGGAWNFANDPQDWSPTGVPQPGDSLVMTSGTINAAGNGLAGDILTLTGQTTLNLFGASADVTTLPAAIAGAATQSATPVINIIGTDDLRANVSAGTIDIAPFSRWVGGVNAEFIPSGTGTFTEGLVVNGGIGSSFVNSSGSNVMHNVAVINANVLGVGSFSLEFGSLEFGKSVGSGQTVGVGANGTLHLDDPTRFHGTAVLEGGFIDLANLGNADSYTYENDLLSVFSGDKVIDTLRLVNNTSASIEVAKANSTVIVSLGTSDVAGMLPLHA